MIKKKSLRFKSAPKVKSSKPLVLKKHHAKPYRKRHYGLLLVLIASFLALIGYVILYREDVADATRSARNYVNNLFNTKNTISTINSTYGFSISYDTEKYYSGAIDTATGDLFFGSELETKRAYEQIRFSTSKIVDASNAGSMTLQYYPRVNVSSVDDPVLQNLETGVVKGNSDSKTTTITKIREEKVEIDGNKFIKTEWSVNTKVLNSNLLELYISTYRASINSNAFIIKIAQGTSQLNEHTEIINSLKFGTKKVVIKNNVKAVEENYSNSSKVLNSLLFTSVAKAQSTQVDGTEKIAAKYSPAVVQIWNLYCTDINYRNQIYIKDVCRANRGSGFFIGSDGHIATNGHVVSSDTKDLVISDALSYAYIGNTSYLNNLIIESGVKEADLLKFPTSTERFDYLIDKFYGINNTIFTSSNKVSNLLVLLNEKTPDVNELKSLSLKRQEYPEQDSIKRAEIKAIDFRFFDGVVQWRASDVAIIKIAGQNYPLVKTGSVLGVTQGSPLTILGYPSQASNNTIVDEKVSQVTLTSGKVSAIKNAKGSDKILIETDTTIGKGNSGGPAFDSSGLVVGISTYTSDGGGTGGGTYNYIRNIQDVLDVATRDSVVLNKTSTTQLKWEEGLDLFYKARYSKAVKKFQEVKKEYPQHSKIDVFIASANEKILNGQDVKDFPYLIVGSSGFVLLLGLATTITVIINHKKKHNAYKQHVESSGVDPSLSSQNTESTQTPTDPINQLNNPELPNSPTNTETSGDTEKVNNQDDLNPPAQESTY